MREPGEEGCKAVDPIDVAGEEDSQICGRGDEGTEGRRSAQESQEVSVAPIASRCDLRGKWRTRLIGGGWVMQKTSSELVTRKRGQACATAGRTSVDR